MQEREAISVELLKRTQFSQGEEQQIVVPLPLSW